MRSTTTVTGEPPHELTTVDSKSGIGHTQGTVRTIVDTSYGPSNTGSGNQINLLNPIFELLLQRQSQRPSQSIVDEDVRYLRSRFVKPPGWAHAEEVLGRYGYLLLDGAPGIGRRSTALQLLDQQWSTGKTSIKELLIERFEEESYTTLDPNEVEEGDRLLLDMSDCEESQCLSLQAQLLGFRARLREQKAALTVILPSGCELRDEFKPARVRLGRPNGEDVLRRHLSADGFRDALTAPITTSVATFIATAPMREIADLARSVHDVKVEHRTATLTEWLDQALNTPTERARTVEQEVAKLKGRSRALLLTCALLERSHLTVVSEVERDLLKILGYPESEEHKLDNSGFSARLRDLGQNVTIDDNLIVSFHSSGYAETIRNYFWNDFPSLHKDFLAWVKQCVKVRGLTSGDRENIASRFSENCLRVQRIQDIIDAAETWAKSTETFWLAQCALERGLRDTRHGAEFRQTLYQWATSSRVSPGLDALVIALSDEVLAPNYPRQAIVRLHQLFAHRQNEHKIAKTARDKLVELAQQERYFRILLARLVEERYARITRPYDQLLFLDIADPILLTRASHYRRPLITDSSIQGMLVKAWHVVLASQHVDAIESRVCSWLRTYAHGGPVELLSVLIEACDRQITPLAKLVTLGRRWLRDPNDDTDYQRRHATVRRLCAAIAAVRAIRRTFMAS